MEKSSLKIFDVIVVGAGHAGLSMSYMLLQNNIKHIVFERGQVAETWRSQRWDSFALNTPGFMNILPGENCEDTDAEGFLLRDSVVTKLKSYAKKYQLPVWENTKVISVTRNEEENCFAILVNHKDKVVRYICRQLVIASGALNTAKIPSFSKNLPWNIQQLHVLDYRNANQLPAGNILVIGSGQSGGQVAEDLAAAGRKVYLSTSKVGRVPRSYRGLDILDWLCNKIPFYHALRSEITDTAMFTAATPLVSGTGKGGHTLSLQLLYKQGVALLGRLLNIENDTLFFAEDLANNIRYGDQVSMEMKETIEAFISKENFPAQKQEEDTADMPDEEVCAVKYTSSLSCSEANITTVIWTTGFTGDFSWIKLPVLNEAGKPVHDNGVSPVPGLFFLGFPWLRSRKSGIIYGMTDDAVYIMNEIFKTFSQGQ